MFIQAHAKVRFVVTKTKTKASDKPVKKKTLMQTTVKNSVVRQFDALARAAGHSRAYYLAQLVELHVRAIKPKLLRSLSKTLPDILESSRSRSRA
jgi:hypothetical protein